MKNFIETLWLRNETLAIFGALNLLAALAFFILSRTTHIEVAGVNAWYKPMKFALSTMLFSWAMGWYVHYLGATFHLKSFNWGVILLLGFEVAYIALQAGRGQLSHHNQSTPFYGFMFSLMALAATAVTLWTAYVGLLFFKNDFPELPDYYLWGIRLGILIFVIFSFEGFVMGSRLSHTIGGQDGGSGIPFLGWSTKFGDPRVAHFIGMHALQVLPLLAFYVLKNTKLTLAAGLLYGLLAVWVLALALAGKPVVKM
ncbi:MAG: hypothetical protein JNK89_02990 [Saprospiraceae bacterium]|nr:hypothetical protein [Saprospiraceae bacterium]